jgi:hypothetical protein
LSQNLTLPDKPLPNLTLQTVFVCRGTVHMMLFGTILAVGTYFLTLLRLTLPYLTLQTVLVARGAVQMTLFGTILVVGT